MQTPFDIVFSYFICVCIGRIQYKYQIQEKDNFVGNEILFEAIREILVSWYNNMLDGPDLLIGIWV